MGGVVVKIYTARQLAEIVKNEGDEDMSLRKVRYYRDMGLLPECEIINNEKVFTDKHLHYLRAIRTLAKTNTPLKIIEEKLNAMTMKDVEKVARKMQYFNTERAIADETIVINDYISVNFSPHVSLNLKEKIITKIQSVLKEEKN